MKEKAKLTIETERIVVIRSGRAGRRAVCEACSEEAGLLTADEAARLARVSARAIYQLVEAGKIHFTETAEGLLLVCFNSLCRRLLQADAEKLADNPKLGRRTP